MEDSLVAIIFLFIGVALVPLYVWIQSQDSLKQKLKDFTRKSWSYLSTRSIPILRTTRLPAYVLVAILSALVVALVPLGLGRGRKISDVIKDGYSITGFDVFVKQISIPISTIILTPGSTPVSVSMSTPIPQTTESLAYKLVAILLMLLVVAWIPLCLWRGRLSLWTPAPPPTEPPAYILVKQWGGVSGEGWKFIPKGVISQITIAHGEAIRSIMFKTHDGETSKKYGGTSDTDQTDTIDIKPGMRLAGISGTVDVSETHMVVTSLRFYTNENDLYGPFGTEKGTTFSLSLDGHIVGFHGHAMGLVDAIGVYLKPISEAKTEKIVDGNPVA